MKLYYSPNASSLAPHIALQTSGLKYDLVKVDLVTKRTELNEDYLAINPKGYVPLLELANGTKLTECSAILQYIADQAPDAGLAPAASTFDRYSLQEWLNFISTEIHKAMGGFFRPDVSAEYKATALSTLTQRLSFLDDYLAKNQYLVKDKFTIADMYLFTILRWAHFVNIDLSAWPHILQYLEQTNAQPAVQATLQMEAGL
jgi:glutathione S-transferase